jgi:predicted Fe-Mo cluster-binding NifX family protein
MKTAFSVWKDRIAPVFDVAREIRIVESESGEIVKERRESLTEEIPAQKAFHLADAGVDTLVCGAISRPLQAAVSSLGVTVVPFIAGDIDEIVRAWFNGNLPSDLFAMPGCYGRGRGRFRGSRQRDGKESNMNGPNQGGRGSGRGMGRRFVGAGRGRLAQGPAGNCVCPKCGHQESHQRGVPCLEMKCPKCGIALVRS